MLRYSDQRSLGNVGRHPPLDRHGKAIEIRQHRIERRTGVDVGAITKDRAGGQRVDHQAHTLPHRVPPQPARIARPAGPQNHARTGRSIGRISPRPCVIGSWV